MYMLINAGKASKYELDNCYTLDEALKLYAIFAMGNDMERGQAEELKAESNRHRH